MCIWYYIQICILHSTLWQKGSSLHRGKYLSHPSQDSSETWWFGLFAVFHAQFERLKRKIILTSFTLKYFHHVIIPGYSFSISLGFGPRLMPHSHQLNMFLKQGRSQDLSKGGSQSYVKQGHHPGIADYIWFIPLLSLVYQRAQAYYRGMKAHINQGGPDIN